MGNYWWKAFPNRPIKLVCCCSKWLNQKCVTVKLSKYKKEARITSYSLRRVKSVLKRALGIALQDTGPPFNVLSEGQRGYIEHNTSNWVKNVFRITVQNLHATLTWIPQAILFTHQSIVHRWHWALRLHTFHVQLLNHYYD